MKKYRIPIFTEEYAVNVVIGKREEVIKELVKYTTLSPKTVTRDFNGRGVTYNLYPDKHPIIGVDGELKATTQIATIAHEAVHAIDYLMEHLGIGNESEFRGHGVAAILRKILN